MSPTRLLAVLPLLLAGCGDDPEPTLPAGSAQAPDIILISVDTLRADHLSSYGHSRQTSPFFDRLAAEGTRYTFARSASPWTLPAHTSMLTGQLPVTHKVVDDGLVLDPGVPVLPELMRQAGYHTGGFVATMYVSTKFGFDRGFERFEDFGLTTEKKNLAGEVTATDVVDGALAWWAEQPAGEPVFLFLHVYDVHYEYDPPGAYATLFDRAPDGDDPKYKNYFHFKKQKHQLSEAQFEHQRAQYDESIRYVNDQFERLETAAKAAGRDVRFVITADHGEEFGERGTWGHAHTLYAEQLHVPMIVSGAGLPKGKVEDVPVGTQDVAPTIAHWVGKADALQADGVPMVPGESPKAGVERVFPAETTRFKTNRLGLYAGGLRVEWDLKADKLELFDPHADPKEALDLSAARPGDLAAIKAALEESQGAPWEAVEGGVASVETGVFLKGGLHRRTLLLNPGDRFTVLPWDAPFTFQSGERTLGPFQAVGGERPGDGLALRYVGGGNAGKQDLDAATRAALQALGYMQDDDGGEEEEPGPPPAPAGPGPGAETAPPAGDPG